MKASNSLGELYSASELALNRLGCEFLKNGREGFAEFEITRPSDFIVRIEDLNDGIQRDWKFLMFSRVESGCSVVILTPSGNQQSTILASRFVRELVHGLKRKPWEGLGHVRSRTAKILWERWKKLSLVDGEEDSYRKH